MRRKLIKHATALVLALIVLVGWPAFLMPVGLYEAVHGWRYPKQRVCGDVVLNDAGPAAAGDRYVADFGALSLDDAPATTFALCRLPREWMTVGFEVQLPGVERPSAEIEALQRGALGTVIVNMTVRTDDGRTATSASGRLGTQWTWSHSGNESTTFIYPAGATFAPLWLESYVLELSIVPGARASGVTAELLMLGGGWKTSTPPASLSIESIGDYARSRGSVR